MYLLDDTIFDEQASYGVTNGLGLFTMVVLRNPDPQITHSVPWN